MLTQEAWAPSRRMSVFGLRAAVSVSQRGWLDHLGALGLPERRQQSIVDVALHTRTKLLKGHFRSIGEPQTVVMWAALQASEGDVFICRYAERSLYNLRDAFEPQFRVIRHAHGG